jgi:FlaA1/EpsC-like NDP-sugar epimerase
LIATDQHCSFLAAGTCSETGGFMTTPPHLDGRAVPLRKSDRVDLRDLPVEVLLGRPAIDTGIAVAGSYLIGKRVLVTGAGGSIGSELCRQIQKFEPAELVMLDHDESALHSVYLSIHQEALMDSRQLMLASIRDVDVLTQEFRARRPEVVFHAAALKHLPMLERHPAEAWKSNVLGTANVIAAARAAGVQRFVGISTDKAANPTSVLGLTKRIGERLIAGVGLADDQVYLSVRFGNVLGSRGSVLTTFADQIATGSPITITHPDVSRYFMTIPEACQLVIQAGAIGRPREVLVLDMGEPVRIVDLARRMMHLAGSEVDIVFTGLRESEKLHEELFSPDEVDSRPLHPLISHVDVPPLADELPHLPPDAGHEVVLDALRDLVGRGARIIRPRAAGEPSPRWMTSARTTPTTVVTGGAGFIGANLCAELRRRDVPVVVLDDLSTGRAENLEGLDIDLHVGSVLDRDLLAEICSGANAIVHLAAIASVQRSLDEPALCHEVNATGTLNVCEIARRTGAHLVFASSSAVYGLGPVQPASESAPLAPVSPYAASKAAAEGYINAYAASLGLSAATFRFFNVFGPLQPPDHAYAAVIPAFVDAALRGEPLTVHGDGKHSRDFVYVQTVAEVLATAAIERMVTHGPVNLGRGVSTTINDLVDLLAQILGRPVEVIHGPERVGDVRHSVARTELLRTMFPGLTEVPLLDALRATVAWSTARTALETLDGTAA